VITGLFETHIDVENLERSIAFYKDVMGLTQCYTDEARRIAFFWVGAAQQAMLGIWEKPKDKLCPRHFAFSCSVNDILYKAAGHLRSQNLKPYNFLKSDDAAPMVFAWMPALAIYFNDPDGNALEYIAILPGEARPELGVISYEDWIKYNNNDYHCQ
jgi:lactoylglutathione lyase